MKIRSKKRNSWIEGVYYWKLTYLSGNLKWVDMQFQLRIVLQKMFVWVIKKSFFARFFVKKTPHISTPLSFKVAKAARVYMNEIQFVVDDYCTLNDAWIESKYIFFRENSIHEFSLGRSLCRGCMYLKMNEKEGDFNMLIRGGEITFSRKISILLQNDFIIACAVSACLFFS